MKPLHYAAMFAVGCVVSCTLGLVPDDPPMIWRGSVYEASSDPNRFGNLYATLAEARTHDGRKHWEGLVDRGELAYVWAADVLVLDKRHDLARVRVLTGPEKGREGWMIAKYLK